MGNCRLTFSLYAGLMMAMIFLVQAFTIAQLFDSNTEQGTDGLMLPQRASVTVKQPLHLNNFIIENSSVKPLH